MFRLHLLRGMRRSSARRNNHRSQGTRGPRRTRHLVLEQLEERALLSYSFTLIAENNAEDPYSSFFARPNINNDGTVTFHANLRAGGEGMFTNNGDDKINLVADTNGFFASFYDALTINDGGTTCFIANLKSGGQGVFTKNGDFLGIIAITSDLISSFAGEGARINNAGTVAFHANLREGGQGIFTGHGGELTTIANTNGVFSSFVNMGHIMNNEGTVAFTANLQADGGQAVVTGNGGTPQIVVDTSGEFSGFVGPAASVNDAGTVGFVANLTAGGQAVYTSSDGVLKVFVDTNGPFAALISHSLNNQGHVFFAGTTQSGITGVFSGPDPEADKVIAIGDPLFGSTVTGFSGGPINDADQQALRVLLADGRQVVVRADPDEAPRHPAHPSGSLAALLQPSMPVVLPGLVGAAQELSPTRVDTAAPPAGISLQEVTFSPLRQDLPAQPPASLSRLAGPAPSSVLDLVFADYEQSGFDHTFLGNLSEAFLVTAQ